MVARSTAALAGLGVSLAFAWLNFAGTSRWGDLPGALHGDKKLWYIAALATATIVAVLLRKRVGQPIDPGHAGPALFLAAGALVLLGSLLLRFPFAVWSHYSIRR